MLNFLRDEKGASMVLTVLAMVVLIGFAALALDGGNLYFHHTRLQDIADACALAACNEMVETEGGENNKKNKALDSAIIYAGRNNLPAAKTGSYTAQVTYGGDESGTMILSFPNGVKKVKVDLVVNTNLFFARVLGFNPTTPVKVSATARAGQVKEQNKNLIPVCFFWDSFIVGKDYGLSLDPGNGFSGNYGFLDYEPSEQDEEKKKFRDYLEYGYNGSINVGDQIFTYPGESVGQVDTPIKARISRCKDNCEWDNFQPDCPKAVIVPIVKHEEFTELNGKKQVTVIGFARIFLIGYDKKTKILSGVFIGTVDPGEVVGEPEEYMVQAVRLVE